MQAVTWLWCASVPTAWTRTPSSLPTSRRSTFREDIMRFKYCFQDIFFNILILPSQFSDDRCENLKGKSKIFLSPTCIFLELLERMLSKLISWYFLRRDPKFLDPSPLSHLKNPLFGIIPK